MNNNVIFAGVAFIGGVAIGFGAGYYISKKLMEEHCQQAIDEMKEAIDKEKLQTKDVNTNEDTKEDTEKEVVRIDKPSIVEMSSIVNSHSNSTAERTKYSISDVKESIKKLSEDVEEGKKQKKERPELSVINYDIYSSLTDVENEKEFTYDSDTEEWRDYESDAPYAIEDLPFDPADIIWDDNDQCYVCDKGSKSVYILEKV